MKLPASLYFTLWGLAVAAALFGQAQRIGWLTYAAIFVCLLLFVSEIRPAD
jgi:hypothetical protein